MARKKQVSAYGDPSSIEVRASSTNISKRLSDWMLLILSAGGGGGGGDGGVSGPIESVNNNFAAFNGTGGDAVKDSGKNAASFATATQGALAASAMQPGDTADDLVDGATNLFMVADERAKLSGIAASADVTEAAILAAEEKIDPDDADLFGGLDSGATDVLKRFTWASLKSALKNFLDPYFDVVGASAKTLPVDADTLGLIDSADSSLLKKLSFANLKAALKGYFDPLYADGRWKMLAASAVGWANTGNTSENTVVTLTGVVPAGAMGPNGRLRITTLWAADAAVTLTGKVKVNSTTIQQTATTNLSYEKQVTLRNQNSAAAQVSTNILHSASYGPSSLAKATYSFDTAAALDVTFTLQNASGADTTRLLDYLIEVLYLP